MAETGLTDMVFKTRPYVHQLRALEESRDKTAWALAPFETGTGKSKVTIDTMAYLFGRGEIDSVVILASLTVSRVVWLLSELPTHLPDHISRRVVAWGPQTRALERQLDELMSPMPLVLKVLVVNIEALVSDRCFDYLVKFLNAHRSLLVIDESTLIKNRTAGRTKRVFKLGRFARYRRILTGTPVTQSPLDFWSQAEFLRPGFFGSYYAFRSRYAVLQKRYINGRSFDEVIGYQRLDELKSIWGEISSSAFKKDCLDLPPKVYEVREVQLTQEQRRVYESIKKTAVAQLRSGELLTAPLVITQLLKLRQALCNIGQNELGQAWIDERDPRLEAVLEILAEAGGQKIIIWANFVPSVKKLAAEIAKAYSPQEVGYICGEVPADARVELVKRFQDPNDPLKYLVMQTRTGGHGITLTAATLMIYHDHDWSLEVRLQTEDRAHRIGQKNTVTYIDIVARGTVEDQVREALVTKKDLADQVTGARVLRLLEGEEACGS